MIKRTAILAIVAVFFSVLGMAQNPITVSVYLTPNPSPKVKDMYGNKGLAYITVTNTSTTNSYTMKAIGNMTHNGKVVSEATLTSEGVRQFTLSPGQSVVKYVDALVNFNTFDFGTFAATALRTGVLPAGYYQSCNRMYDVSTNQPISDEFCFYADLSDYYPSELLYPMNDELLYNRYKQFQWTPVTPHNPNLGVLDYELTIWQLNEGESPLNVVSFPTNAIKTMRGSLTTQFVDLQSICTQNGKYVWTVQAYTSDGVKIATTAVPRVFEYNNIQGLSSYKPYLDYLEKLQELEEVILKHKKLMYCDSSNYDVTKYKEELRTASQAFSRVYLSPSYSMGMSFSVNNGLATAGRHFLSRTSHGYFAPVLRGYEKDILGKALKDQVMQTLLEKAKINVVAKFPGVNWKVDCNADSKSETKKKDLTKDTRNDDEILKQLSEASKRVSSVLKNYSKNKEKKEFSAKENYEGLRNATFDLFIFQKEALKNLSDSTKKKQFVVDGYKALKKGFPTIDTVKSDKKLVNISEEKMHAFQAHFDEASKRFLGKPYQFLPYKKEVNCAPKIDSIQFGMETMTIKLSEFQFEEFPQQELRLKCKVGGVDYGTNTIYPSRSNKFDLITPRLFDEVEVYIEGTCAPNDTRRKFESKMAKGQSEFSIGEVFMIDKGTNFGGFLAFHPAGWSVGSHGKLVREMTTPAGVTTIDTGYISTEGTMPKMFYTDRPENHYKFYAIANVSGKWKRSYDTYERKPIPMRMEKIVYSENPVSYEISGKYQLIFSLYEETMSNGPGDGSGHHYVGPNMDTLLIPMKKIYYKTDVSSEWKPFYSRESISKNALEIHFTHTAVLGQGSVGGVSKNVLSFKRPNAATPVWTEFTSATPIDVSGVPKPSVTHTISE